MENEKISNIINGIPASMSSQQIMELGARCSSEGYPLQKLIQISKTLFKNDSESSFRFLQYVEKHEINRTIFKDFSHNSWKIQIYYSLAALALTKALKQNDKLGSEKLQKQFVKYLNAGTNVKTSAEKLYQLLHGFNSYYAGDFSKAINNFNMLDQFDKKQGEPSTIALLGLAQSHFMLRKYDKALQYYKKALTSNKNLPIKARLGMAYCFFELQKYELAEKCFQRILALDSNCSQAYLGLAIMKYRNNDLPSYFANLKQAYKLNPNSPLAMLHLAEHFLLVGQYDKCQKMSRKGLLVLESAPKFLKKDTLPTHYRDDFQIFKARFNNLIGQVFHSKNQYEQAKKHYELAKDKGLKFNEVALAQTYAQTGTFKQSLRILENLFSSGRPAAELKILSEFYKTIAYFQVKAQSKSTSEETSPNNYYKQAIKYHKNDYDALVEYSVYLNDTCDKKQTLKMLQTAFKSLEGRGKQSKIDLLNNYAVSLMEEKRAREAHKVLDEAIKLLAHYNKSSPQQEMRHHALHLTVYFNKAIALEEEHRFHEAIQIHRNLITFNKYYVDSYVKLADLMFMTGQKSQCLELLENAVVECQKTKNQEIRLDKLIVMKGFIQHQSGSPLSARETFKRLGKISQPYDQYYEMSIAYEAIMHKQVDRSTMKDFLHANRSICIQICEYDPYNLFSYMMLVILFAVDNKITKEQAIQYFNQLKVAELQFPQIQYNFGVYSMLNEDYENALFCLNRYKQRVRNNKADEYIALTYFLKEDYVECINQIKKNLVNEPNNLRYRFQYALAIEKRVQKLFEEEKNFKDLKLSTKYLKLAKKTYESLTKIVSIDYVKTVDNPEVKQRMRAEIAKIRSSSEDRERFVESQLSYYGNKQKQVIEKERKLKEEEARKLQEIRRAKDSQKLMAELGQDDDESDTEKQRRQRRRKLEELAAEQAQRANEQWRILQERQKLEQEEKGEKKRRNAENRKPKKQRPRATHQKMDDEQELASQQQFKDEDNELDDNQYEQEGEQIEKQKKKKKKNKDKDRQERKKRKKQKKDRKQRGESDDQDADEGESKKDEDADKDAIDSEKGSNPFSGDQKSVKSDKQQKEAERQEPQKKQNKKKNHEDDDIDINNWLI